MSLVEPWNRAALAGKLMLFSGFYCAGQADRLMTALLRDTPWQQPQIRVMGRDYPIPRLQAWYGDGGAHYQYAGLKLQPQPWTPLLWSIKGRVERQLNSAFNSVLVNRYRDGQDSVGWHSDDEPELGRDPLIASLSLGATRAFRLQHRQHQAQQVKLWLAHGDLLVMQGDLQHRWRHQLPKSRRVTQERINLTFRFILPS